MTHLMVGDVGLGPLHLRLEEDDEDDDEEDDEDKSKDIASKVEEDMLEYVELKVVEIINNINYSLT